MCKKLCTSPSPLGNKNVSKQESAQFKCIGALVSRYILRYSCRIVTDVFYIICRVVSVNDAVARPQRRVISAIMTRSNINTPHLCYTECCGPLSANLHHNTVLMVVNIRILYNYETITRIVLQSSTINYKIKYFEQAKVGANII